MGGAPFGPLAGLLLQFVYFVNGVLVPVIFALAFLVFLWGVYLFFFNTSKDAGKKREEGRSFIIYGLIGFFVMLSVWGIVNILINSVGLDPRNNRPTPMFLAPYGPGIFQGGGGVQSTGGGSGATGNVPLGGICQKDADCVNGLVCFPQSGAGTSQDKVCSQ